MRISPKLFFSIKPIALSFLACAVLAACNSGGTQEAAAPPPPPPPPQFPPQMTGNSFQTDPVRDASFAELINGVRMTAGADPLTFNSQLNTAAQRHAKDMVDNDYFSHRSQDGRTLSDRVAATGYAFTALGENIARGQRNEQEVLDGWQKSDGHRANNLNPDFEEFGLGRSGSGSDTRWVLVLGAQ